MVKLWGVKKLNYKTYIEGESVVDQNANYAFSIANIRRQLQAQAEREWNLDCMHNSSEVSATLLARHEKGEVYIHDMTKLMLAPYCYSFSLLPIVTTGLNYNPHFKSHPAKRLTSFAAHVREFFAHVAVRTRGACGFPDLFVCMAYYTKKYKLLEEPDEIFSEGQTKREYLGNVIQQIFYSVNQNLREGSESMFSNISFFDRYYCESLFQDYFKMLDITVDDVMQLQKFVMEWHTNEILNVKMLRWPVITVALLKKKDQILDCEFLKFACEQNVKHTMYNFLVLENAASIASCCRLINQGDHPFLNSYGSGSVSIGSHQVVALNLPHLWLKSRQVGDFRLELREVIKEIIAFLDWHRALLKEHEYLDEMYAIGLRSLDRMFSTIGIIGFADLQEIANFNDNELESIIKFIESEVASYKRFTNIELVPAESAAIKLFDADKEQFGHKTDFYKKNRMYSNQIVDPWCNMPLTDRLKKTSRFAKYFSGGSMTFISLQDQFEEASQMVKLVEAIALFDVPYFCFDCNLSKCETNNHFALGYHEVCPVCNEPASNYRRTVGFFVPLHHMHERQTRDIPYRFDVIS